MAGRPKRRARLAEQAARTPAARRPHTRWNEATRLAVLQSHASGGYAQVARDHPEVPAATVRGWVSPRGSRSKTPGRSLPAALGDLNAQARRARDSETKAAAKGDRLLEQGRAADAAAAARVAESAAKRASGLENDARLQREHEARLGAAERKLRGDQVDWLMVVASRFAAALGLAWRDAEPLFWAVHGQPIEADDDGRLRVPSPPEPESRVARGVLRRRLAVEPETVTVPASDARMIVGGIDLTALDAEIEREISEARAGHWPPAEAAGSWRGDDQVADDADREVPAIEAHGRMVSWADVPESWRSRFRDPHLALYEYANALLREEHEQARAGVPRRQSNHPSFRHEGLGEGSL